MLRREGNFLSKSREKCWQRETGEQSWSELKELPSTILTAELVMKKINATPNLDIM